MARRVLTLEVGEQGPSSSNIIQWNRFYSCKDYQQPFKQSPDNAPIIRYNLKTTWNYLKTFDRDPALPMINVATDLLSWNPFRKEIAKWLKQLDLYDEDTLVNKNETLDTQV